MSEQKRRTMRWVKIGAGWFLLALGVAGLFLPFIQGLLCIAAGLTLLSTEYEWARVWLARVKQRLRVHPRTRDVEPRSAQPTVLSIRPIAPDDPPS